VPFPAKKNAGCPKASRDFPLTKEGFLHPHQFAKNAKNAVAKKCRC